MKMELEKINSLYVYFTANTLCDEFNPDDRNSRRESGFILRDNKGENSEKRPFNMVIPIEFYCGINAENTIIAANEYLDVLKRMKRNYGWDELSGDITASLNLGTPNLSVGVRIYKFAYDCLSEVLNETGKDEDNG